MGPKRGSSVDYIRQDIHKDLSAVVGRKEGGVR